MEIIVLDGNQRSALAVTRSLGKRRIKVTVGAETLTSLSSSSKYCSHCFSYPSPNTNPDEFIRTLKDHLANKSNVILLPMTDITLGEVLKKRNEFVSDVKIPFADHDIYMAASDKVNLLLMARELRIPIPQTIFSPEHSHVIDFLKKAKKIGFPVVLKPAYSRIRREEDWLNTSVHYVRNEDELKTLLKEDPFKNFPFVIQEKIDGPGIGIFLLMDNGNVLAQFAHRRVREKPPTGGLSVLCESIEPPELALNAAKTLLKKLRWSGVAMVEFKEDLRDKTPKLMEVNARFWGSLQLAISAGVDFPYLLFQIAAGAKIDGAGKYRLGVRSRWELGDLDHLLIRLKEKPSKLFLPSDAPSKMGAVKNFLVDFLRPSVRNEILRPNDMRPFRFELKEYLKSIIKKKM